MERKGSKERWQSKTLNAFVVTSLPFPQGPLTLDEASIQGLGEAPTLSLNAFLLGNSGAFLKACIND